MVFINFFNIINVYEFKIKFYIKKVLELRFLYNKLRKFKLIFFLVIIIYFFMYI